MKFEVFENKLCLLPNRSEMLFEHSRATEYMLKQLSMVTQAIIDEWALGINDFLGIPTASQKRPH